MAKIKKLPWIIAVSISGSIKAIAATLRVTVQDPNNYLNSPDGAPRIYAIWHNRAISIPPLTPRRLRPQLTFLASRSKDGGYISDVLARFNMKAVRGSSSRGGAAALKELVAVLEEGRSIVITPDGPRGPRYQPKNGIIFLASQSGVPIVPVSFNARSHHALKTWDQTQIPYPFSKGELIIGDPILVAPNLDDEAIASANEQLRLAMMAITHHDGPDIAPRERKKSKKSANS